MTHQPLPSDRYQELARAFRVLADPARLRILGALATESLTGVDLARRLELTPATISHHLAKLENAGLVASSPAGTAKYYELRGKFFDPRRFSTTTTPAAGDTSGLSRGERDRERTLRAFFDGERLRSIPANRKQLVIVIQHLLHRFEPERDYPERAVNDLLRTAHDDVATLRRELVDYGYLIRANGIYRMATALPERGIQLRQEMTVDEDAWFRDLAAGAVGQALKASAGDH